MGSLASRPKAPTQPQVVYVQQSSYTPSPPAANASAVPAAQTPEESASEVRKQNLLERSRGIFGTVLTGFRGFLSPSQNNTRKSLLGE